MASSSSFRSLTRRADFLALKKSGNILHVNSWLLINWRQGEKAGIRCGWTIPSHIGSSVLRNRLKRWGREFMRKWSKSVSADLDINVIFKRKEEGFYRALKHKDFQGAMEKMAAKLNRVL